MTENIPETCYYFHGYLGECLVLSSNMIYSTNYYNKCVSFGYGGGNNAYGNAHIGTNVQQFLKHHNYIIPYMHWDDIKDYVIEYCKK